MNDKLRNSPLLVTLLTLISFAGIILCGDYFIEYYIHYSIVAVVVLAVIGSVFTAVLAYLAAISNDEKKLSTKKIIIMTVVSVIVYNLLWFLCTFICNVGLGLEKSGCVIIAFIFEGVFLGILIGGSAKSYFKKYNKSLVIAIIAVVSCVSLVFGCAWVANRNSLCLSVEATVTDADWALDGVPEYTDGKLSVVYNCGKMMETDYDENVEHDEGKTDDGDSLMQVARKTDAKAYAAYREKLAGSGFVLVQENALDDNLYATYEKDGYILHTYYTADTKEVRIIKDLDSDSPAALSYTGGEGRTEIYQYSLYYDSQYRGYGKSEVCGMLYVVKLADDSLIIIDGGMDTQATDTMMDGFWAFCNEITGTQNGEKLNIAAWYCSHAHQDHFMGFYKFLKVYHDKINLQRVLFNFPSYKEIDDGYSETTYTLAMRLKTYAPDALQMKVHTGQYITLSDVRIDVLYTHEDAFNYKDKASIVSDDFNDSSTVLKLTFGGKRFLVLGDINKKAAEIVADNFSEDTLRADIVQAAHHGMNNAAKVYAKAKAPIVLIPTGKAFLTEGLTSSGVSTYKECQKYAKKENIFFADQNAGTVGIWYENGEAVIEKLPYVGTPVYDGSF